MSAIRAQDAGLVCSVMQTSDLDEVVAVEQRIYSHPWTKGNFQDSLNSDYYARLLRDTTQRLVGYFLLMPVFDEAHLLNLSVDADRQHQGYGQRLMGEAVDLARLLKLKTILLEVRVSNRQALSFYKRYGFCEIGRRKRYYPTATTSREDAIMMTLPI